MSRPRKPTSSDFASMSEALALITAYDIGTEEQDFTIFSKMIRDVSKKNKADTIRSLAQLGWLMSKNSSYALNKPQEELLSWYGEKFAQQRT